MSTDSDSMAHARRSHLLHEGRWVSIKSVECDVEAAISSNAAWAGWSDYKQDIFGVTRVRMDTLSDLSGSSTVVCVPLSRASRCLVL